MTNPDIRAALEAAALAICDTQGRRRFRSPCECKQRGKGPWGGKAPCAGLIEDAVAASVALLRAMPSNISLPTGEGALTANMSGFAMLANAIERETSHD